MSMQKNISLKCLVLIITLLIAQIGSAFAGGQPSMGSDCDMDMTEMTMNDKGGTHHESVASSSDKACCDMPESATCCENECQCFAFFASLLCISGEQNFNDNSVNAAPLATRLPNSNLPYITKPKRPPIYTFS